LIIKKIFTPTSGTINLFKFKADFAIAFIMISLLIVIEILIEKAQLQMKLRSAARPVKWILLILTLLVIFVLGKWESIDFLYFQF
jgi:hypothetical protein